MPRVILATLGTLGDLHPFIALGRALNERGAVVAIATSEEYRNKVAAAGLDFHAVRPSFAAMEARLGMTREAMTRAVLKQGPFLLEALIAPSVRDAYEDMYGIIDGADLVMTSSLAFGARLAAERRAVPWLGVVLQPMMFLSAFDPPVIPPVEWLTPLLRALGPAPTRVVLALFKRAVGRQLRVVKALRREIGLPPTNSDPLFEGQFADTGAIGLYSELLGGLRADYPRDTVIAGFACFDSGDGAPACLGGALGAFLDAGPPPLVCTLGSLIVNSPGSFYRESVAAARQRGLRAVLLVGEDALARHADLAGPDVHVSGYAPHSLVFPRAAVIVHQSGIGTLAQALKSGRPQLIVPFYADQADNAARAVKLGVARVVAPRRYHASAAAREIERLVQEPSYGVRAAAVQREIAPEDGAARTARLVLERLESGDL